MQDSDDTNAASDSVPSSSANIGGVDPTSVVLAPGDAVKIVGLQSAAALRLNGKVGIVRAFIPNKLRYEVELPGSWNAAIRRSNLYFQERASIEGGSDGIQSRQIHVLLPCEIEGEDDEFKFRQAIASIQSQVDQSFVVFVNIPPSEGGKETKAQAAAGDHLLKVAPKTPRIVFCLHRVHDPKLDLNGNLGFSFVEQLRHLLRFSRNLNEDAWLMMMRHSDMYHPRRMTISLVSLQQMPENMMARHLVGKAVINDDVSREQATWGKLQADGNGAREFSSLVPPAHTSIASFLVPSNVLEEIMKVTPEQISCHPLGISRIKHFLCGQTVVIRHHLLDWLIIEYADGLERDCKHLDKKGCVDIESLVFLRKLASSRQQSDQENAGLAKRYKDLSEEQAMLWRLDIERMVVSTYGISDQYVYVLPEAGERKCAGNSDFQQKCRESMEKWLVGVNRVHGEGFVQELASQVEEGVKRVFTDELLEDTRAVKARLMAEEAKHSLDDLSDELDQVPSQQICCSLCKSSKPLNGLPLLRGCSCEGNAGLVHPHCLEERALKYEEGRTFDNPLWTMCPACGQNLTGQLKRELSKLEYERYKALPPSHKSHKQALSHLAASFFEMDEVNKAFKLYQELCDIVEKCIERGEEDPNGINVDHNICCLTNMSLCTRGFDGTARATRARLLNRAIDMALARDGPCSARVYSLKAHLLKERVAAGASTPNGFVGEHDVRNMDEDEYQDGILLGQEVLDGLERTVTGGIDSQKRMEAVNMVSWLHFRGSRIDEAMRLAHDNCERTKRVLGPRHSLTFQSEGLYNMLLQGHGFTANPKATLAGLKKYSDLNGDEVEVVAIPPTNVPGGRYVVRTIGTQREISVRPGNLILQHGTKVAILSDDKRGAVGSISGFCSEENAYHVESMFGDETVLVLKPTDIMPTGM